MRQRLFLTPQQEILFLEILNNTYSDNTEKCRLNFNYLRGFIKQSPELLNYQLPSFSDNQTVFGAMSATNAGRFILLSNPLLMKAIHPETWHTGEHSDINLFIKYYLNNPNTYKKDSAAGLFALLDPADLNHILSDGDSVPSKIIEMLQTPNKEHFPMELLPNIFKHVTDKVFLHGGKYSAASLLLNTSDSLSFLSIHPDVFMRIPDDILLSKMQGCAGKMPLLLTQFPFLGSRIRSLPCALTHFILPQMNVQALLQHPEWLIDLDETALTPHAALLLLEHQDGRALLLMSQPLRHLFCERLFHPPTGKSSLLAYRLIHDEALKEIGQAIMADGEPLQALVDKDRQSFSITMQTFDEGSVQLEAPKPRRGLFGWFDKNRAQKNAYQPIPTDDCRSSNKKR